MDVPYLHLPGMLRKQAVALRQKMLQSPVPTGAGFAESAIARLEANSAACQEAVAPVLDCSVGLYSPAHTGEEVRQMKERPRPDHSQRTRGIQREKINSAQTTGSRAYIRPQIEFAKRGRAGNGNASLANSAGSYLIHPERHYANPGIAVEGIYLESCWKQPGHLADRNWPMREQQIIPPLRHSPATRWQLIRPMGDNTQNIRHRGDRFDQNTKATRIKYSGLDHVRER